MRDPGVVSEAMWWCDVCTFVLCNMTLGDTALHLSCRMGFKDLTKELIDMEAELDVADAEGFYPLMVMQITLVQQW